MNRPARADNAVSSESTASEVCEQQGCWASIFPTIAQLVPNGQRAVEAYAARLDAMDAALAKVDSADEEGQKAQLEYRFGALSASLKVCEDLKTNGGLPSSVIVVGHQFAHEGQTFREVAQTIRKEKIAKLCAGKTGAEQIACAASVMVIEDKHKGDIGALLDLLPPESIDITYVGHGIDKAIGVGGKNLLLPREWNSSMRINHDEWVDENQGMVYVEDLTRDFGRSLKRVLKPGATVDIYACDTGANFSLNLRDTMQAEVRASVASMHFAWLMPDGTKIVKANYVPGGRLILESDTGKYGVVKAAAPGITEPVAEVLKVPARDKAVQDITLLLMTHSDSGPIQVDDGRRTILFSNREREVLRGAFGNTFDEPGRKWIGQAPTLAEIQEKLKSMTDNANPVRKVQYEKLLEKVQDCVNESLHRYYRPDGS